MQRGRSALLWILFILNSLFVFVCSCSYQTQGSANVGTVAGFLMPILFWAVLIYFFGIKPYLKRKSHAIASKSPQKNTSTLNYDNKGTAGPIASVILGIILLVAGLVSFFMRYEILKQFVSSRQRLEEAFYGGNTVETALTYVVVASGVAMIIGLIILVLGVVKLSKSN